MKSPVKTADKLKPVRQVENGSWLTVFDEYFLPAAVRYGCTATNFTDDWFVLCQQRLVKATNNGLSTKKRIYRFTCHGQRLHCICFVGWKTLLGADIDGRVIPVDSRQARLFMYREFTNAIAGRERKNEEGRQQALQAKMAAVHSIQPDENGIVRRTRWTSWRNTNGLTYCEICGRRVRAKNFKQWKLPKWKTVVRINGMETEVQCCTKECKSKLRHVTDSKDLKWSTLQQMNEQRIYEAKIAMDAVKKFCTQTRRGASATPRKALTREASSQGS